jgi:hypothetical protein
METYGMLEVVDIYTGMERHRPEQYNYQDLSMIKFFYSIITLTLTMK